MTQPKHKYRVSVYLGKELYEQIEDMANILGISISTMTKIILNTGFQIANTMDAVNNTSKGGETHGNK